MKLSTNSSSLQIPVHCHWALWFSLAFLWVWRLSRPVSLEEACVVVEMDTAAHSNIPLRHSNCRVHTNLVGNTADSADVEDCSIWDFLVLKPTRDVRSVAIARNISLLQPNTVESRVYSCSDRSSRFSCSIPTWIWRRNWWKMKKINGNYNWNNCNVCFLSRASSRHLIGFLSLR